MCSLDSVGGLHHRLAVANQLWHAGIAAEYLHPTPASFDLLHHMCTSANILVLVLVPQTFQESGIVKVRPVGKRRRSTSVAEASVDIAALPAHIAQLLEGSRAAPSDAPGLHTPMPSSRTVDAAGRKEDEAPPSSSKQASIAATNVTIELVEGATAKTRVRLWLRCVALSVAVLTFSAASLYRAHS